MIGWHKRNFNLVPYQENWIKIFEQEAALIQQALGDKALQIKHHGSTSIPGMSAKPIIDIMVAIESFDQIPEIIPLLENLGYIFRGDDTIPARRFFVKESSPEFRTHHLSLTLFNSSFWTNHLAFPDYLRKHDRIAKEYVDLKNQIKEDYNRTKELDREAKTAFIRKVLEMASK